MLSVWLREELLLGALTFRLEFRRLVYARFASDLFDNRAVGRQDAYNLTLLAPLFLELARAGDSVCRLRHYDSVLVDAQPCVLRLMRVLSNRAADGLLLLRFLHLLLI